MKILHVNAGNEFGGGLFHIIALFQSMQHVEMDLLVLEEGPVAEMARENNINVYVLEQKSRYDLSIMKSLLEFVERNRYDLIHSHGPRANALLAYKRRAFKNIKWVITLHSNPHLDFEGQGIKGKLFERIMLYSIKKADHIIAVSSEMKEIATKQGIKGRKVTVIHNGIDTSEATTPNFNMQDEFTLITAGRLEWVKGYQYLMEALKIANLPNWKWIICGTGRQEAKLKEQVEELGFRNQVEFVGWVNKDMLEKYFTQSDIMVLPSLSETFPLIALEAGQYGLPLIATDVGDVKQIIPRKDLGWLIPSKDERALAKALNEVYEMWETKQLSQMSKKFYEWTHQFSTTKQAKATYKVYSKILK